MNRELTIKKNIYGLAVFLMAILTGCIYRPGTGYSFEEDDELFEDDTMNDIGDDTTGGIDPYQYLYGEGPGSAKCAWEIAYDTGSIMALADKKWAEDNAPDFHVSTPEELASVVYYVNTTLGVKVNVTIENDIDLTGYDWMPMGWSEFQKGSFYFSGTVDGGGHTIQGMHLSVMVVIPLCMTLHLKMRMYMEQHVQGLLVVRFMERMSGKMCVQRERLWEVPMTVRQS